mmetsp:Transcript_10254/g.34906  ORF Transcript_10254/g.34906 Transcript_10254/m.34906 type:complete len:167 (-) Transcript_10254:662-1162(-)
MEMMQDDALSSFIRWEKSLRGNLTDQLWDENPEELAGQWVVVEGFSSEETKNFAANPLLTASDGPRRSVDITLRPDGRVEVPKEAGQGITWKFSPGPAHLDTCEFTILKAERPGTPRVRLTYTGYVDRGQRIESRFSGRPIKMTGRVVATNGADVRATDRFVMELK